MNHIKTPRVLTPDELADLVASVTTNTQGHGQIAILRDSHEALRLSGEQLERERDEAKRELAERVANWHGWGNERSAFLAEVQHTLDTQKSNAKTWQEALRERMAYYVQLEAQLAARPSEREAPEKICACQVDCPIHDIRALLPSEAGDVYVYEAEDGFRTHVAGQRAIVPSIPKLPTSFLVRKGPLSRLTCRLWWWSYRMNLWMKGWIPSRKIGLAHDGESFIDDSPAECAERLMWLRSVGYNVPQYAIDDLRAVVGPGQGVGR